MEALREVLPSAIAFAFSPIAIVEMILVLFSRRARVNGVVFLVMIVIPVVLIPLVGAKAYQAVADPTTESAAGTGGAWFLLILGALMLLLALANWNRRADASVPKVFDTIEGMGPGAVAFLAIGVTLVNPKNLAMLLAAGQSLGSAGLESGELVLGVLAFAVVATLPFLVVIGYRLLGGAAAAQRLDRWKAGLLARNHLIMAIVLGVLGLVLAGRGLSALV